MVAIYILFWALSVFLVLPWGVRTSHEANDPLIPGQAESAPHEFRVGPIAKRVTVVATTLFGLFLLNYHFGWIDTDTLDFVKAGRNSFD